MKINSKILKCYHKIKNTNKNIWWIIRIVALIKKIFRKI